jgi:hypothetical protein
MDHILSSLEPQSLEWTCMSFEQSVVELYAILLEERFEIALEMF